MKTIKTILFSFTILFAINGLYAQLSIFDVKAPSNLAGRYLFGKSVGFGQNIESAAVTGNLVVMRSAGAIDSVGANTASNSVTGKIAVIYRGGGIGFSTKAYNAEQSGAIACIIINKFNGVDNTFTPDQYYDMPTTGETVNIPVIMISENTGKLLRSSIDAANLVAYIGKTDAYYENNLSLFENKVLRLDGVIPKRFASTTNFTHLLGANVINSGTITQQNLKLDISIQSNTINYHHSVIPYSSLQYNYQILLSENVDISTFPSGYYSITYTISSDAQDQYTDDNTYTQNFWITDDLLYSKGSYDANLGSLSNKSMYGSYNTQDFSWCIPFESPHQIYDGLTVSSISTSLYPTNGVLLSGKEVTANFYEWNDTPSNPPTVNSINLVGSSSFTFTNEQRAITIPFSSNIKLVNTKKYLACINKNAQADLWIGTDYKSNNQNAIAGDLTSCIFYNNNPYPNNFPYNLENYVPTISVNMTDCNCSPSQTSFTLNDYHRVTNYQVTSVTLPTTCEPDLNILTGASWLSYTYGFANNIVTLNITTTDNTTPTSRVSTISINGKVFTITQPGTGCVYSLSNSKYTCTDENASVYGNISTVSTTNNCTWTTWVAEVTSGNSWLSTTSSATGNAPISISVLANTSDCPRTGTISVYGAILTIEQPGKNNNLGCAFSKSNWILEDSKLTSVNKQIFAIEPTSATNVWAIARDTNAYTRTLDGGLNWTNSTITGANNYRFSNISALNKDTAWVSMYLNTGLTGDLFYTHNGGASWNKSDATMFKNGSSFPNLVHFFNKNNGVTMGDPVNGNFELYTTTDAGQNWTTLNTANIPVALSGEYGLSNTFAHIGDIIWFTTNKARVFRSIDKGYNWTVTQIPYNNNINSIAFKDANNGICTSGNSIFRTTDGGNNWNAISPSSGYLYADQGATFKYVKGTGDLEGRYIGASTQYKNTSVYSVDNGDNWVQLDTLYHSAFGFWDAKTGWTGATPTLPLSTKSTIYGLTVCSPVAPSEYTLLSDPSTTLKLADVLEPCANDDFKINAKGSGKLSWYDNSTNGNLLSSKAELKKSEITWQAQGETYVYVQDSSCYFSPRTLLTIRQKAIPTNTVSTSTIPTTTITANQLNATYQWLNCTNNFSTITNANTRVFTPIMAGEYAVLVTADGCSDTSDCIKFGISGLDEISRDEFKIYPNPSTGLFTISGAKIGNYAITNEVGAVVYEFTVSENVNQIITINELSNGIYFLKGTNGTDFNSQKIVVID